MSPLVMIIIAGSFLYIIGMGCWVYYFRDKIIECHPDNGIHTVMALIWPIPLTVIGIYKVITLFNTKWFSVLAIGALIFFFGSLLYLGIRSY